MAICNANTNFPILLVKTIYLIKTSLTLNSFLAKTIDLISLPFTFFAVVWLKFVRLYIFPVGKRSEKVMMKIGLFPLLDQYYEPLINPKKHLTKPLSEKRSLPGLNLNVAEQLSFLDKFDYNEELLSFPLHEQDKDTPHFHYHNEWYTLGDAEYLYNMIRYTKPKRIIEVGSGVSTLLVIEAIKKNKSENSNYTCQHICIEPYERPWLSTLDVELIRKKVETVDIEFFQQLEANDLLFIDSSHIIRPQGDVLFEYLEVLPTLQSGVYIHVHDVFTPRDYDEDWILKHHLLWNEQYLLEAFLSFNNEFKIIGALNFLSVHHKKKLGEKCPVFATEEGISPRAFWMQRL